MKKPKDCQCQNLLRHDVVKCGKNLLRFRVYDTDTVLSYYTSVNLYQARRCHTPQMALFVVTAYRKLKFRKVCFNFIRTDG